MVNVGAVDVFIDILIKELKSVSKVNLVGNDWMNSVNKGLEN